LYSNGIKLPSCGGSRYLRKRKIKSIRKGRRNILEKGLARRSREEVKTEYDKNYFFILFHTAFFFIT
jgi:hypothetical protein